MIFSFQREMAASNNQLNNSKINISRDKEEMIDSLTERSRTFRQFSDRFLRQDFECCDVWPDTDKAMVKLSLMMCLNDSDHPKIQRLARDFLKTFSSPRT